MTNSKNPMDLFYLAKISHNLLTTSPDASKMIPPYSAKLKRAITLCDTTWNPYWSWPWKKMFETTTLKKNLKEKNTVYSFYFKLYV